MRIRWERILGAALIAASIWLFIRLQPLVKELLDVANYGPDSNPVKALMLGAMCVSFVAGIKLLFPRKES